MKEELLNKEKTREERTPKGRTAREAARDKALPAPDAGSRSPARAVAPEAGLAGGERERTPVAPEGRRRADSKPEAKKDNPASDPALHEASGNPPAERPAETARNPSVERPPETTRNPERAGHTGTGAPAHREAPSREKEPTLRERESALREIRDLREMRESRELRDLRETREIREPRDERPEKRDPKEEKEEMLRALKMLAPGTPLREGLESILRAKMGALIILGDSPEILELVEGGFRIDTGFTPPNLYELAKMDGAIILSQDAQQILYANTQLVPDPLIPSEETGIRHRTAQRFACQTGAIVIAISHRRGVITLYKGTQRYILREIGVILSKANQAIQTLERYKRVLDKAMVNLTALEFEELVTVFDVAKVVQRGEMVLRIVRELEGYLVELGVEGRLVTMQAEELVANVEDELFYVIQDYHATSDKQVAEIKQYLSNSSPEDLLELSNFSRALGYGAAAGILDLAVFPHGYRILHKIPKLPTLIIENLVHDFVRLQNIVKASIEELDAVEGIGEARARAIKNGMRRLQEQVMLDRYM